MHRPAAVNWGPRPRTLRAIRATPHGHGYDPTPVDRKFTGARRNRTRSLKPVVLYRTAALLPARKPSIRAAAFSDISGPDMVTGNDEHVLAVTTHNDLCAWSEPITFISCRL
jgi:hypothetical protein